MVRHIEILANQFPFLSEGDLEDLSAKTRVVVYSNKSSIINIGEQCTKLFFILEGMVRGYNFDENGEERTMFIRPTRTFFTAPRLIENAGRSEYCFEAIQEIQIMEIDFTDFVELSNKSIGVAKLYIEALRENVLTLISRVEMLAGKSPEERYELMLAQNPVFFQKALYKDIANYLGMTPNSLSRIIKRKRTGSS